MPVLPSSLSLTLAATVLPVALLATAPAQNDDRSKDQEARRPKVSLRAQPSASVAPSRIVFTAQLAGGSDDFQEFYCPTIEWDWGDGTASESTTDCEPWVEGTTQIKRRYTIQHQYRREGSYKVYFHMKRNDKRVGSASTTILVQPGGRPSLY